MDASKWSIGAWVLVIGWMGFWHPSNAVAQSPTTIATYTYNAKGERITKTMDGVTTYYNYDEQSHLLSEHGPNGSRDYIYVGDILVNTVDTPATPATAPSTVNYVTTDHTNTPRAVTNSAGTVVWQNPYQGNAWGEQPITSNGFVLNIRGPGQYYDEETGLIYNNQRYIDPNSGRFTQPDLC
jgi:YD repeat-containing protein